MDGEELSGTILTRETKTVFQPREGKVLNLLNDYVIPAWISGPEL
jgi:hypothetical protein